MRRLKNKQNTNKKILNLLRKSARLKCLKRLLQIKNRNLEANQT